MYVLAILLACPGVKICVFSTGKRASGGLTVEIMDRIRFLPDASKRVIKQNQEQLWLSATALAEGEGVNGSRAKSMQNDADISRLYSFPASVAG
jgi:hypothetical protein